jgi:hypothetical protein
MYDGFNQNMPCPLLVNMVRAGKKSGEGFMIILKVKSREDF